MLTEVVKKRWIEGGKPAQDTRSRFKCPWGPTCRNKDGAQGMSRQCNNVHDMSIAGTIDTTETINAIKDRADVKTYRDIVNALSSMIETE